MSQDPGPRDRHRALVAYLARKDMTNADPRGLMRAAMRIGFPAEEAALLSSMTCKQLIKLQNQPNRRTPVLGRELIREVQVCAVQDALKNENLAAISVDVDILADAIDEPTDINVEDEGDEQRRKRFKFSDDGLSQWFDGKDPYVPKNIESTMSTLSLKHSSSDIITGICRHIELAVELGKHLGPHDIIKLYSISKSFHAAINGHMLSSVRAWIGHRALEAASIFDFRYYKRALVTDPAGRTWVDRMGEGEDDVQQKARARLVPGMKYLQMVLGRDRYIREIMAIMARNGHRMPKGMYSTLLRLWFLMEICTSRHRLHWLADKRKWTDQDLYNAQFFFVKLSMHFSDPVYGTNGNCNGLLRIMLGQKGLYPLWQLLMCKKYRTFEESIDLFLRYDYEPGRGMWADSADSGELYGVPLYMIGQGHLEGWGKGSKHLMRPDEVIPVEAIRRGLELDDHLMDMVVWGYIDFKTGENLVPTEDELYISDEENALEHVDTRQHWRRKHALKKQWPKLTPEQRREIIEEDQRENMQTLPFCGDEDLTYSDGNDQTSGSSEYSPEDEIIRGFQVPTKRGNKTIADPDDNSESWDKFVTRTLFGMEAGETVDLPSDYIVNMQSKMKYHPSLERSDFDWIAWMDSIARARANEASGQDDDADDEDDDDDDADDDADDDDQGSHRCNGGNDKNDDAGDDGRRDGGGEHAGGHHEGDGYNGGDEDEDGNNKSNNNRQAETDDDGDEEMTEQSDDSDDETINQDDWNNAAQAQLVDPQQAQPVPQHQQVQQTENGWLNNTNHGQLFVPQQVQQAQQAGPPRTEHLRHIDAQGVDTRQQFSMAIHNRSAHIAPPAFTNGFSQGLPQGHAAGPSRHGFQLLLQPSQQVPIVPTQPGEAAQLHAAQLQANHRRSQLLAEHYQAMQNHQQQPNGRISASEIQAQQALLQRFTQQPVGGAAPLPGQGSASNTQMHPLAAQIYQYQQILREQQAQAQLRTQQLSQFMYNTPGGQNLAPNLQARLLAQGLQGYHQQQVFQGPHYPQGPQEIRGPQGPGPHINHNQGAQP